MMPLELLYTYAILFTLLSFLATPAPADSSNSERAMFQRKSVEGLLPTKAQSSQEFMEEKPRLGSIPPNCRNKCNACSPCQAIQAPTLPTHGRLRESSQSTAAKATAGSSKKYSNYKPMGWKCKCGNRLFNP